MTTQQQTTGNIVNRAGAVGAVNAAAVADHAGGETPLCCFENLARGRKTCAEYERAKCLNYSDDVISSAREGTYYYTGSNLPLTAQEKAGRIPTRESYVTTRQQRLNAELNRTARQRPVAAGRQGQRPCAIAGTCPGMGSTKERYGHPGSAAFADTIVPGTAGAKARIRQIADRVKAYEGRAGTFERPDGTFGDNLLAPISAAEHAAQAGIGAQHNHNDRDGGRAHGHYAQPDAGGNRGGGYLTMSDFAADCGRTQFTGASIQSNCRDDETYTTVNHPQTGEVVNEYCVNNNTGVQRPTLSGRFCAGNEIFNPGSNNCCSIDASGRQNCRIRGTATYVEPLDTDVFPSQHIVGDPTEFAAMSGGAAQRTSTNTLEKYSQKAASAASRRRSASKKRQQRQQRQQPQRLPQRLPRRL